MFPCLQNRGPLGFSEPNRGNKEPLSDASITVNGPLDSNYDGDSTSYRFKCHHGIDVKITPLILPAVTQFEVDMERNVSSDDSLIMLSLIYPIASWSRVMY